MKEEEAEHSHADSSWGQAGMHMSTATPHELPGQV